MRKKNSKIKQRMGESNRNIYKKKKSTESRRKKKNPVLNKWSKYKKANDKIIFLLKNKKKERQEVQCGF